MKAMVLALTSLSLLSGCVVYANVSDDGDFWSDSELQHETRKLSLDMTDIEDGSGSIEVRDVGDLNIIESGSGSLRIEGVGSSLLN